MTVVPTVFRLHAISSIYSSWELIQYCMAQSAGAGAGVVEYTDCFSVEGKYPLNESPGYDTKQSDGEAPVILEL